MELDKNYFSIAKERIEQAEKLSEGQDNED